MEPSPGATTSGTAVAATPSSLISSSLFVAACTYHATQVADLIHTRVCILHHPNLVNKWFPKSGSQTKSISGSWKFLRKILLVSQQEVMADFPTEKSRTQGSFPTTTLLTHRLGVSETHYIIEQSLPKSKQKGCSSRKTKQNQLQNVGPPRTPRREQGPAQCHDGLSWRKRPTGRPGHFAPGSEEKTRTHHVPCSIRPMGTNRMSKCMV